MKWSILYKSLFTILRIDTKKTSKNMKVAGTGFVINTNPIYILTCNHVVSEANENNSGSIIYSIAKRSDKIEEFDLRKAQLSYLKAKRIFHHPEYDLAILEIDPLQNKEVAQLLGIPKNIRSLKIDFLKKTREIGLSVEWISTGTLSDLTLTPRLFKGSLVTKYITDHGYDFIDIQGNKQIQIMKEINILEIDQLFLPGCSGSPIVSSKSGRLIGYVHGFKSWPISTNSKIKYQARISDESSSRDLNIDSNAILVASLSLGIDIKNIKDLLIENNFIK